MERSRPLILHKFLNSNKYLPECGARLSVVRWSFYNVHMVYALIMICRFPWKLEHKLLDCLEFTFITRWWFHRYGATWPVPWTLNMEHVRQYENEFRRIFFFVLFHSNVHAWRPEYFLLRGKCPAATSISHSDVHERIFYLLVKSTFFVCQLLVAHRKWKNDSILLWTA